MPAHFNGLFKKLFLQDRIDSEWACGIPANTNATFCLLQGEGHLVEGARQCVEFMLGF